MKTDDKLDFICTDLIKSIEIGRYKVDEKLLPERKLAEKYDVSRATIREALNYLKALGYIYTIKKTGNFVTDDYLNLEVSNLEEKMKIAPISDLMELRIILEIEIIRLAVKRADREDIYDMKMLVADMVLLEENPYGFHVLDLRFHKALAKATNNLVIINLMDYILDMVKLEKDIFVESGEKTYRKDIKTFNSIISAIENRNENEAVELLKHHLKLVEKSIYSD